MCADMNVDSPLRKSVVLRQQMNSTIESELGNGLQFIRRELPGFVPSTHP